MIIDSFFEQGVTHEVCEDYAHHGDQYVAIADGCSNAGGPRVDTDWGSRLMCLAAARAMRFTDHLTFVYEAADTAKDLCHLLRLDSRAMAATLLTLRVNGDSIQAIAIGDGFVGGKQKDGKWVIHHIQFPSGAPYYLKYRMFQEEQLWKETHGDSFTVTTYTGNLMAPGIEYPDPFKLEPDKWPTAEDRNKIWQEHMPGVVGGPDPVDFDAPHELFEFPMDEFEFVFVSSDGTDSFYQRLSKKDNQPLHPLDVFRVLLDVKVFRPGFLRQQRYWNFKQDRIGTFKRRDWHAGDDVSVGGIYCV